MFVLIAFGLGVAVGSVLVKQPEAGVALVNTILDKVPALAPLFNRTKG